MRRLWAALVASVVVCGVLTAVSPAVTVAVASPAAPVASPSSPLRGERFTITGKLSTKVVRPVRLQVRTGKKWKKAASGKTDTAGSYSLVMSSTASSVKVRVYAPKVKVHGKKYKAITTKTRTIKPAKAAQTAKLSMPSSAQVTEAVNATLSFTPARVGRPVVLQAWVTGAWTTVASGVETNSGTTVLQLTATTIGTFSYRATAQSWNGLAATSSATVKLAVTASRITIPDTTRPLTDAEAAAITSYDAASGTLALSGAPASLAQVVAGDAITIPPRNGIASGALRKVTKVTTSGSTTTLSTEATDLPAAIQNIPDDASDIGMSVFTSRFAAEDGVTVASLPAKSGPIVGAGVRPASTGELKLNVSKKWESADKSASADLEGSLSISPVIDANLDIDWFKVKGYRFGAGVQTANDLKATFAYQASAGKTIPLGTLTQVWVGAIGAVPIWVEADFNIYVKWTISGAIELTAEVTQNGKIASGVTNTGDYNLAPKLYSSTAKSATSLLDLGASGELGVFAGADADLMLYSLAGPYATLGAEADATINGGLKDGFTCKVVYGPHAEVGLKASDGIKALTGKDYKLEAQIVKPTTTSNLCPTTKPGGGSSTLAIAATSLPPATVGIAYSTALTATGGTSPYTWTATGLPAGLSVNTSGTISGTPNLAGSYTPTVTVTDNTGTSTQKALTFSVSAGGSDPVATAIAAGDERACALTSGGAAKCWGENGAGALGDGTTIHRSVPVQVSGLTSGVTAITTAYSHTCAVISGGAANCWGYNEAGDLGTGITGFSAVPVQVSGLTSGVMAIAAGGDHTCAITSGGAVKCWGNNGDGQLGDGTTVTSAVPVQVSGLTSGVTAIAAGYHHTCAMTSGGAVKCWGYNWFGQLGDGTTVTSTVPVQVSGMTSGVTAIAAGDDHTCAITSGGAAKCWGDNGFGQLGDGTVGSNAVPVQVSGLTSGVTAVAAGDHHTCAITSGGAARCWGYNTSGQLGDGTIVNEAVPVQVSGLTSGVTAVAAGDSFACAMTSGGTVKCWGYNRTGELGDGTTNNSTVPVQVTGFGG